MNVLTWCKSQDSSVPAVINVPEVLNVHMNEIYTKLTTIKFKKSK